MSFYRKAADGAAKLASKAKTKIRAAGVRVKNWFVRSAKASGRKISFGARSTVGVLKNMGSGGWQQTRRVSYRVGDVLHSVFVALPAMLLIGVFYTAAFVYDVVGRVLDLAYDLWVGVIQVLAHALTLVDVVLDSIFYVLIFVPIFFLADKFRKRGYMQRQVFLPNYDRSLKASRWLLTPLVVLPLVLLIPFNGWAETKAMAKEWTESSQWYWSDFTEESPHLTVVNGVKEHTVPSPVQDEEVYTEDAVVDFIEPGSNLEDHDEVHIYKNSDGSRHVLVIGLDSDFNFDMSAEDVVDEAKIKARVAQIRAIVDDVQPESGGYTPGEYDWKSAKDKHTKSYLYGRSYVASLYEKAPNLIEPQRTRAAWSLLYNKAKSDSAFDVAQLRRGFLEEIEQIKSSLATT